MEDSVSMKGLAWSWTARLYVGSTSESKASPAGIISACSGCATRGSDAQTRCCTPWDPKIGGPETFEGLVSHVRYCPKLSSKLQVLPEAVTLMSLLGLNKPRPVRIKSYKCWDDQHCICTNLLLQDRKLCKSHDLKLARLIWLHHL